MHAPSEIGVDDFQANRAPGRAYRIPPLRGLWTHKKGGFYHDGRFRDLLDVVNHYDQFFALGLTPEEKSDLIEYLKSLWALVSQRVGQLRRHSAVGQGPGGPALETGRSRAG